MTRSAAQAGITPIMVGCVMLQNEGSEYGALPPAAAADWASANGVPFLDGPEILRALGVPVAQGSM
jgi:3,4-dihydroxy 2-butanone 4-phosphate synthase